MPVAIVHHKKSRRAEQAIQHALEHAKSPTALPCFDWAAGLLQPRPLCRHIHGLFQKNRFPDKVITAGLHLEEIDTG